MSPRHIMHTGWKRNTLYQICNNWPNEAYVNIHAPQLEKLNIGETHRANTDGEKTNEMGSEKHNIKVISFVICLIYLMLV